jgi:hypothetical protein
MVVSSSFRPLTFGGDQTFEDLLDSLNLPSAAGFELPAFDFGGFDFSSFVTVQCS